VNADELAEILRSEVPALRAEGARCQAARSPSALQT
jgi:hypothetical protein